MSGNPEKPPIVPEQTPDYQNLPPPPPGPPPAASEMPPSYSANESYQAPAEKAPLPQQTGQTEGVTSAPSQEQPHLQQQEQHAPSRADTNDAAAFYKSSDQYEEPAPPLPGPRPTQQATAAGGLPAYDPANPHFAPPPSHQNAQYSAQQPHGTNAYGGASAAAINEQEGTRRNWSSMLTEMGHKAAAPINALANKLGSQSFLPTSMDKECYKAAQILRSFCKDGITSDAEAVNPNPAETKPEGGEGAATPNKKKQRKPRGAIVKIPSKVIAKAQGLAIFTTARVGFNFSGATGSGVLISRLPDGSWSPPSGIQVHALGAGFMIGVDIYDCVCVINSREALSAFMSTRVSLGPDVAVTAGPWGAGGHVDWGSTFESDEERKAAEAQKAQLQQQQQDDHVHEKPLAADAPGAPGTTSPPEGDASKLKPQKGYQRRNSSMAKPVFSYVKSRGFYAGVTVDGTIITERKDANAAFYGQRVSVEQILAGQVPAQGPAWPAGGQSLYEALRVAEAQQALPDANMPPPQPAGQQPGEHLPPQTSGVSASRPGDELPGYQDDGVHRPVDEKVHFA